MSKLRNAFAGAAAQLCNKQQLKWNAGMLALSVAFNVVTGGLGVIVPAIVEGALFIEGVTAAIGAYRGLKYSR